MKDLSDQAMEELNYREIEALAERKAIVLFPLGGD